MKRFCLKPIFTLTFILYSLFISAQTELKNQIVDFGTMLPIESASIYIQNTTTGTISNADGKFVLLVPESYANDTLVVSSIGYKSFKVLVGKFDNSNVIYLEEDIAALDEVLLVADTRPKTGNEIVLKALEKLSVNFPEAPYVQKGFLRYKERNTKEFKWLIESAITLYDSSFTSNSNQNLKINVDQMRKSYDLRDVDSLLVYTSYLKQEKGLRNLKAKNLKRDTIKTSSLVQAIKWNDRRTNGLEILFGGKLNILRNSGKSKALFGEDILKSHQFELDTILVDNDRKIYKIRIDNGSDYVNLETKGIYNDGYHARGWMYVYWDNYAIKKIEYELVAASPQQKSRSKVLFGTQVNHKLVITFMEYHDKMYPNYLYYETPKLVNVGKSSEGKTDEETEAYNKEERYYYSVQELLFTEIVVEPEDVAQEMDKPWDANIFSIKPYDKAFWKNYNTLLESEEDEQLIKDLTQRSTLYKE
ncbi:carboxypeptidase-like regulatory domain-containing protein [Formosa sp. S-31]|uniref:carboxypeptidase-like regulatory domain-containing protein n=1 Tax=Formosa sp. S-31 TaxID=2790949 RepID=UPI003EC0080B